jgi:tetratricopeptide (TPR) repeat protein
MNKKGAVEIREEALRPSPYLGYNRDALGTHLASRGAWEIAEPQFRRAIWLNPFEPRFKVHLAWCVYKQGRLDEARSCLAGVDETDMDESMQHLFRLIIRNGVETNGNR